MFRTLHRKTWYYVICGLFSLIVTFTFFGGTAFAQTSSRAVDTISPVGTWHSTVTEITGSRAGQQEMADFTFTSGGGLSTIVTTGFGAGVTGTGTWTQTGPASFSFNLIENVYANGQLILIVQVQGDVVFTEGGNGFMGASQAVVDNTDGVQVSQGIAVVVAQRA